MKTNTIKKNTTNTIKNQTRLLYNCASRGWMVSHMHDFCTPDQNYIFFLMMQRNCFSSLKVLKKCILVSGNNYILPKETQIFSYIFLRVILRTNLVINIVSYLYLSLQPWFTSSRTGWIAWCLTYFIILVNPKKQMWRDKIHRICYSNYIIGILSFYEFN